LVKEEWWMKEVRWQHTTKHVLAPSYHFPEDLFIEGFLKIIHKRNNLFHATNPKTRIVMVSQE